MTDANPTQETHTPASDNHIDVYDSSVSVPTLFRHTRRETWGLGIVEHLLDDRVKMQFQDGRSRTFKKGYYHFLDAVDRPLNQTLGLVDALRSMMPDDAAANTSTAGNRRPVSMDEQIAYLRERFAGGFQDEEYAEYHRGDGRKRPLKRHRDPLVQRAQDLLGKKALGALVAANDFAGIHAAAVKVTNTTDLVKAKERKVFKAMDPAHYESFALALRALLHGTSKLSVRIDAYVSTLERALGDAPTWELTTVILGSVHPEEHLVVRERVLSLQSEWMAPGLSVSTRPMGLLYERLLAMAKGVRDCLKDEGLAPRDLLDVHDFIWVTLKPAGKQRIMAMRRERGLDGVQTPERKAVVVEAVEDEAEAA